MSKITPKSTIMPPVRQLPVLSLLGWMDGSRMMISHYTDGMIVATDLSPVWYPAYRHMHVRRVVRYGDVWHQLVAQHVSRGLPPPLDIASIVRPPPYHTVPIYVVRC